jgi:N-acetylglucosamine malate deacetylase 2
MNSRADQNHWRETLSRLLVGPPSISPRVAVLAAHPDDETIGASVLLSRSNDPLVIYLTDGAPRDTQLWSPNFNGSREEYAALRRNEAQRALGHAGAKEEQIHWLGAVDQDAVFHSTELARKLAVLLEQRCPDLLITHPYEGGHPDHDAAALIARHALAQLNPEHAPVLLEMASYHARLGQCVMGEFLGSTAIDEICFCLPEQDQQRKRRMFDSYSSQRLVLSAFDTAQERWRKAPDYDFTRPPHQGKLWYECMGWPTTGGTWRAGAAASIAAMQEQPCR